MSCHEGLFARLAKSRFRSRFRLGEQERGYLEVEELQTVLAHARDHVDRPCHRHLVSRLYR